MDTHKNINYYIIYIIFIFIHKISKIFDYVIICIKINKLHNYTISHDM